jgi:hypothetical protein
VAEAVVDRLEVVQVEEDDGDGAAVAGVQLVPRLPTFARFGVQQGVLAAG